MAQFVVSYINNGYCGSRAGRWNIQRSVTIHNSHYTLWWRAIDWITYLCLANMRNWTARIPSTADNATSTTTNIFEMEHFAPYGLDGIIHGAAILTFVFVGFDALVIGTDTNVEYIREFKKTVPASITTVNILSFVCLLGVSVALTLVQAYFMLVRFFISTTWQAKLAHDESFLNCFTILFLCVCRAQKHHFHWYSIDWAMNGIGPHLLYSDAEFLAFSEG